MLPFYGIVRLVDKLRDFPKATRHIPHMQMFVCRLTLKKLLELLELQKFLYQHWQLVDLVV